MDDNYFIKKGYLANPEPRPNRSDAPFAWTAQRLSAAASYQYYVYELAAKLVEERHLTSVLDVGCGPPVKLRRLLPSELEICLVDQPGVAEFARSILPGSRFIGADLETVDVALGKTFDLVVCADVLEHLRDPDPCLSFIVRHLSPSGVAVISTPERDILRGIDCMASPHADHVREWNSSEFKKFIEDRGFRIIDQILYPQHTVGPLWRAIGQIRRRFGSTPSWWCCQVVVCALAANH